MHTVREGTGADIREVTVKSFSNANHIRNPGFQLLSLVDPSSVSDPTQKSFIDRPCVLPDQYGIYSSIYAPFFIFTTLILVVHAVVRSRRYRGLHIQRLSISPQSSTQSTPNLAPNSAIWSPYTPALRSSPRGMLPSHLRTPSTPAGPTLRASRPSTPLGSPLLPPVAFPQEDDDEAMYPTHYTTWREGYSVDEDDQTPDYNGVDFNTRLPHFSSTGNTKPSMKQGWSWSWTFVFRGRRRRITLRVPVLICRTILALGLVSKDRSHVRHHIIHTVMRDGFSTFWPPLILWTLVAWWWS